MKKVNQNGYKLPNGPILMSPDFLLDSAKREVIFKTPEVKILRYFLILFFSIFIHF